MSANEVTSVKLIFSPENILSLIPSMLRALAYKHTSKQLLPWWQAWFMTTWNALVINAWIYQATNQFLVAGVIKHISPISKNTAKPIRMPEGSLKLTTTFITQSTMKIILGIECVCMHWQKVIVKCYILAHTRHTLHYSMPLCMDRMFYGFINAYIIYTVQTRLNSIFMVSSVMRFFE